MTQVPYTFGNETSPIPLSQLDANFAVTPNFANVANTVLNPAQGNITSVGVLTSLSVAGSINAANVTITDFVSLTGNVTAGNLFTGGEVSAFGNITGGNIEATSGINSAGPITGASFNSTSNVSATGNVIASNVIASSNLSVTGNARVQGTISAVGNVVTDQFFVGNFLGNVTGNVSVGGSNTQVLFNLNGNVGAVGGLTYNKDSNVLTVLGTANVQGTINSGAIVTTNGQFSGLLTAPTPIVSAANNQVATTAFVNNRVGTLGTMATQNANAVAITGGTIGPASLTGVVTASTPANGTSNTQVATTAFVTNSIVNYFPSGGIIMWSGSIVSIPAGWFLCDGTNGTPDLRQRFIVGAGNVYAVGSTGGSADAIVVSHTHTAATTVSDPGHFHSSDSNGAPNGAGAGAAFTNGYSNFPGKNTDTKTTGIAVSTSIGTTGSSGTNANLPPYYALAFIMKA